MFKWYLSLRGNIAFDIIWVTVCYCHVSWICLQNKKLKWTFWPHIWSFKCLIFFTSWHLLSLLFLFSNLSFIIQIARIWFCNVQYDLKKNMNKLFIVFCFLIVAYNYFTSVTIWSTYGREHCLLVHVTNMLIPLFRISTIIFTFVYPCSFFYFQSCVWINYIKQRFDYFWHPDRFWQL